MDKQPVGQLPDLSSSNNDDEIMVITNSEYNQLKKEKISDLITDFTSTNENNALTKGTDGKMFVTDFGNASNITEGTLPVSVLPDIPKDKLPEIETDDLPDSGITAGTYTYPTDIVVNSKGQVTSITEGQAGANNANQDLSNLGPLGLDKLNQSKALETGSVSSDADVYADVLKYAHSTFDLSKFKAVGSPNITNDGIASGFTRTSYISFSNIISLNVPSFIIKCKFTTGASLDNNQYVFNSNGGVNGLRFGIVNGKWNFVFLTSDDNVTTLSNSSESLQINTTYYAIVSFDGTKYTLKISLDNKNWIDIYTSENSKLLKESTYNWQIGAYSGGNTFQGVIDLKYFSIIKENTLIVSGNKTGIDVIKPDNYEVVGTPTISDDGIASGFSSSNYLTYKLQKNISNENEIIVEGEFNTTTTTTTNVIFVFGDSYANRLILFVEGVSQKLVFAIGEGSTTRVQSEVIESNTNYKYKCVLSNNKLQLFYKKVGETDYTATSQAEAGTFLNNILKIGVTVDNSNPFIGTIDLNAFKVYGDGSLAYQPCLKIPYTESKTGSKIVDATYRDRVLDMYEQYGYAPYYTIDEENENFTLPAGDIYGMITKNREILDIVYPIGRPMPEENNVLLDNEVWLEGATVNIVDYPKLFKVYGTKYGGDGTTTFKLPDLRNRVLWGSSDGSNGYIEAGLPNIKGSLEVYLRFGSLGTSGAFTLIEPTVGLKNVGGQNYNASNIAYFNASDSNPTYSDDVTTVQPPAFKVRWKTRFE